MYVTFVKKKKKSHPHSYFDVVFSKWRYNWKQIITYMLKQLKQPFYHLIMDHSYFRSISVIIISTPKNFERSFLNDFFLFISSNYWVCTYFQIIL